MTSSNAHQFSPGTVKCVFLTRFLPSLHALTHPEKPDGAYVYIENPFMYVVYCLRSEHAPRRHNVIASSSMNLKIN